MTTFIELCKQRNLVDAKAKCETVEVDVTVWDSVALRYAAAKGHLDVVKFLLTDPSAVNANGERVDVTAGDSEALLSAAEEGHLDVVKFLLTDPSAINSKGERVDVTAKDSQALRNAAEDGYLDIVKFLLTDPSAINSKGERVDVTAWNSEALSLAASQGHLDIVKFLLTDPSAVNSKGERVDVTAEDNQVLVDAGGGYLSVLKFLIDYYVKNKIEVTKETILKILSVAKKNDKLHIIKFIRNFINKNKISNNICIQDTNTMELSLEADEIFTLISKDGVKFEVTQHEASQSEYLKQLLNETDELTLDESSDVIKIVVDFLKYHATNPMKTIPIPLRENKKEDVICEWDIALLNDLTVKQLERVIEYANFSNTNDLFHLGCATFGYWYKEGKVPENYFDEYKKVLAQEIKEEEEEAIRDLEKYASK